MVVHAIGMDPNVDNPELSKVFGVDLESHGHIGVKNNYGDMAMTSRPGVYAAGASTGPETIDDSIAQGHAAAMAVLSALRSTPAVAKTA
jgi:heterodisulfide reductase subunit A